jgi:hypothetical protein
MAGIHITDIEAAINHWRIKNPSPDGVSLPPELRALAEVYGLMVYLKQDLADEFSLPLAAAEAWQDWYATTPDTPCIAICSTSQGQGCSRRAGAAGPQALTGLKPPRPSFRRLGRCLS